MRTPHSFNTSSLAILRAASIFPHPAATKTMTRRSKIGLATPFGYFDPAVAPDQEAPPWSMRVWLFRHD